jgi:hypothetical protein
MSGQISQYGAEAAVNLLSGAATVVVQGSAPSWIPGMTWVNTSSGNSVNQWNGIAWISSPAPSTRYLALLTADPVAGAAVNMTDATFVELTTSGYARQACAFNNAANSYPALCQNGALITWGPMTSTMLAPVQWVAMVTCSSGTQGYFLMSWTLVAPIQVEATQSIQVGVQELDIQAQ